MTETDLQFLWHWNHAVPDPQWKKFDGPYFAPAEYEPFDSFREREASTLASPNRAIIEVDGNPAGVVTRYEEPPTGGGWWEVGIVIFDPEYWSRGIGRTALDMWVERTFTETDAHVITLTTWSGNDRMIRSAAAVGFVECGRVPEARSWNGQRYDSVRMARLGR